LRQAFEVQLAGFAEPDQQQAPGADPARVMQQQCFGRLADEVAALDQPGRPVCR
jgi:hypothetical protein